MFRRMDELPIAEARANLSEITSQVRHTRQPVRLTRRGKPQAAIVPVELAEAAEAAGGMDAAIAMLGKAASPSTTAP
jgi:prevent-host-death family protein